MSRLQEKILDSIITFLEEDFRKTKNIGKSLDNAKIFLNKTTNYVEEQGYSEIFSGFIEDVKKKRRG